MATKNEQKVLGTFFFKKSLGCKLAIVSKSQMTPGLSRNSRMWWIKAVNLSLKILYTEIHLKTAQDMCFGKNWLFIGSLSSQFWFPQCGMSFPPDAVVAKIVLPVPAQPPIGESGWVLAQVSHHRYHFQDIVCDVLGNTLSCGVSILSWESHEKPVNGVLCFNCSFKQRIAPAQC